MKKNPAYQKLAQTLRKQITTGKRAPGSRLPTEIELGKKHGVSRITVRHALQLLEEERLIIRRPKLGTFIWVPSQPHRLVPISIDYTNSLNLHAPEAERTLLACRQEPAGPAADLLKLTENEPVLYSERCDSLNGIPFAWDRGFIPMKYAKNLTTENLGDLALLEAWSNKEELRIGTVRQTVETIIYPVAAKQLGLSAKHPLLKTVECYYDHHNSPCGAFTTFYHPELVQLRICYTRPKENLPSVTPFK